MISPSMKITSSGGSNLDDDLLQNLNHYKKHYKRIYRYEERIDIIKNFLQKENNNTLERVIDLEGIIVGIDIVDNVPVIQVYCEHEPFNKTIFRINLVHKTMIDNKVIDTSLDYFDETNIIKNIRITKELKLHSEDYYYQTIKHGYILKEKFNLVAIPQDNRIMAYLRTNDPKIFDGLKRKSN